MAVPRRGRGAAQEIRARGPAVLGAAGLLGLWVADTSEAALPEKRRWRPVVTPSAGGGAHPALPPACNRPESREGPVSVPGVRRGALPCWDDLPRRRYRRGPSSRCLRFVGTDPRFPRGQCLAFFPLLPSCPKILIQHLKEKMAPWLGQRFVSQFTFRNAWKLPELFLKLDDKHLWRNSQKL